MRRILWVATLLCASLPALAQSDLSPIQRPSRPMREAAQTHYLSGARFFETGQYDAALVEFEAAWRLSGEPDLLHNLSWTHEKAGRPERPSSTPFDTKRRFRPLRIRSERASGSSF